MRGEGNSWKLVSLSSFILPHLAELHTWTPMMQDVFSSQTRLKRTVSRCFYWHTCKGNEKKWWKAIEDIRPCSQQFSQKLSLGDKVTPFGSQTRPSGWKSLLGENKDTAKSSLQFHVKMRKAAQGPSHSCKSPWYYFRHDRLAQKLNKEGESNLWCSQKISWSLI